MLPKDLAVNYASRLLDLMKKDEVLGSLDIGDIIAILGTAIFKLGVDRGVQSYCKEDKKEA